MRSTNQLVYSALAIFLLLNSGCRPSGRSFEVTFVDRDAVIAADGADRPRDPLMLMVAINSDGRLNLNGIELGSISDTTDLTAKLKTVFEDRKKVSIPERDVLIEMSGRVEGSDLEVVIEALRRAEASPIHVIKR